MKSMWGQGNRYLRVRRKPIDISPKVARLLLVSIMILIGVIFIAGDVGLWNLWSVQKQLNNLDSKINGLDRENTRLRAEISLLETDPFTIEKVARERYGYLRPGDRVYRIITLPADRESDGITPSSLDIQMKKP